MTSGDSPSQGGEVVAQDAVGEAGGQQRESAADVQEGSDAGVGEAHPGDAGAGLGDDGSGERGEGGGSVGGIVADAFDVQETPVGGEADLGQRGEVRQLFADVEVAGLVDGGFGP